MKTSEKYAHKADENCRLCYKIKEINNMNKTA